MLIEKATVEVACGSTFATPRLAKSLTSLGKSAADLDSGYRRLSLASYHMRMSDIPSKTNDSL